MDSTSTYTPTEAAKPGWSKDVIEPWVREAHSEGLESNLRRYLRFVGVAEDEVVELFSLSGKRRDEDSKRGVNRVAYAQGYDEIVRLVTEGNGWPEPQGIYLVPNLIIPDLAARTGLNQWVLADGRAKDDHVTRRRVILIDFDPKREPSDVSASSVERNAAWRASLKAVFQLRSLVAPQALGWGASGNGGQIHIAVDLPNNGEMDELVGDLLKVMALRHAQEVNGVMVEVDQSVGNAARLVPAFGSAKRKGADTEKRPWRRTAFLCLGSCSERLDVDGLKALIDTLIEGLTGEQRARLQAPRPEPGRWQPTKEPLDEPRPLDVCNEANVAEVYSRLGGDPEHPQCPGCGATKGIDCLLDKNMNIIKCQHDSCGAKPWSPVSLVARMAFDIDDLTGNKKDTGKVIGWFKKQGLVNLPERNSKRKRRTKSEQLVALEDAAAAPHEKVSGGARDEPRASRVYHPTEEGNARRLVAAFGGQIRYVAPWRKWLVWTGTHWKHDQANVHVRHMTRQVIEAMHDEAARLADTKPEAGSVLKGWALASEKAKSQREMIALGESIPDVVIYDVEQIDRDPWLLNVLNGTLDLRTGELRPHDPQDLIDRVAPVEWHGLEAPAPTWERFLGRVQPDRDCAGSAGVGPIWALS